MAEDGVIPDRYPLMALRKDFPKRFPTQHGYDESSYNKPRQMTVITTCRLLPRGRRGIVRRVQSSALIRINSRREMRAVAINAVPAGNDAGRYGLELRAAKAAAARLAAGGAFEFFTCCSPGESA
jgi:hypothetical protein